MTCDGHLQPVRIQDVKVTNDDEEEENWSDDDEGNKVQSPVCVRLVRGWK